MPADFAPSDSINIVSDACPVTFAKVRLKMENMCAGEVLEIILRGGESLENVPKSLEAEGHTIILREKAGDNFRLLVEKGD